MQSRWRRDPFSLNEGRRGTRAFRYRAISQTVTAYEADLMVWTFATTSARLLGRRMPDLDLVTGSGPRRLFTLLHDAPSR
jgi:hypothetical protein